MSDYTIDPNRLVITDPGKFEGECRWVPHFYDFMGEADESIYANEQHVVDFYKVDPEDIEKFPELKGQEYVRLTYLESGFVVGSTCTKSEMRLELEGQL